ncbi:MAG: peptidyl-prolyl cis-trans isomerase [Rhodocyclaceae bacterium]|nr:peptidyl-prolyl cis-trans isomerase [Rhodocyclaceae bacterium]
MSYSHRFARFAAAAALSVAAIPALSQHPADAAAPPHAIAAEQTFAVVEGTTIPAAQYNAALTEQIRQKFYHGKPPEAEVDEVRRDVGRRLINEILFEHEAKKFGIAPDTEKVDAEIAKYEARYSDSPVWKERRETVLPALRAKLERDSLRERLEAHVKSLPEPTEAEVRAFYEKHPDKFTEPEQVRLGMILLRVDPSSPTSVWQLAEEEAQKIIDRIAKGESFEDLAALHSGDPSADQGGDLGYIHRGMVPEALHLELDSLKNGDISKPIRILEGFAVFKLLDRKPAVHHTFERVQERATGLLARERSEEAWTRYLENLSKRYQVEINTKAFPVFADVTG